MHHFKIEQAEFSRVAFTNARKVFTIYLIATWKLSDIGILRLFVPSPSYDGYNNVWSMT